MKAFSNNNKIQEERSTNILQENAENIKSASITKEANRTMIQREEQKEEANSVQNSKIHGTSTDIIDLGLISQRIVKKWKIFAIVLPIVFVLSCIHILNVPRYYTTSTSLAPEIEDPTASGGLNSIAASFGIDLSQMQSTDAITPLLYPDLMEDNKFVVDLFKIKITTSDYSLKSDYYTYLTKHQEKSWIEEVTDWIRKNITGQPKQQGKQVKGATGEDPYILPRKTDGIAHKIRDNIIIAVDKKTGVISITATAQDPLVCKILADSATSHLQEFITSYRTSKAQKDVDYYKNLMDDSQASYETMRRKYAQLSDANKDVVLKSVESELEDMENDMQLRYNQYTQYQAQYQASIAKLRERTPAFTILKGANVPIRPAGPKRMIFVAGMLILATIVTSLWLTRDILLGRVYGSKSL